MAARWRPDCGRTAVGQRPRRSKPFGDDLGVITEKCGPLGSLHASPLPGEYPSRPCPFHGGGPREARLHATDARPDRAEHLIRAARALDAEGRSPARVVWAWPGLFPRDAVAPRPLPRGYVQPW
ncbi:hypothetical protein GCM10009863_48910 [Streptomyces axinellae]|uniref:Uncharacterized protein n=1 Tax=Streptomyces axinellae TaxID=552788 RepID=A0ABP6CZ90_9ACTN